MLVRLAPEAVLNKEKKLTKGKRNDIITLERMALFGLQYLGVKSWSFAFRD